MSYDDPFAPDQPTPFMRSFAPCCLSIDLEVGVPDTRIHRFGAVRGDKPSASMHFKQGKLLAALEAGERETLLMLLDKLQYAAERATGRS